MEAYRAPHEGNPGFTPDEMKQFVAKHFDEFVNRKNPEVKFK